MYSVRLFCKIVAYKFYAMIEYPGAFFLGVLAQWLVYCVEMVMLFIMVWNFGTLAGWLPAEVIFAYAVWLLTYAIGASFSYNICMSFPQMAISGTLDEAYVRPVKPFLYLLATNYNLGYISHVTLTTAALAFCITRLGVSWNLFHGVWLVVLIVCGSVIQSCMMLLCDMPALRTRSNSPTGMFFWDLRHFSQYPISIYPKPIQFIFTTVLPFGFINFYPLQVLLGKEDGLFANITMWLSPVAALILLLLTAYCWRVVTHRYESAGT